MIVAVFYAGNSAWYIKLNTTVMQFANSSIGNYHFCDCSIVVILLMWPGLNDARLMKNGSRLLDFSSSTVL